jgi:hypothetical protein
MRKRQSFARQEKIRSPLYFDGIDNSDYVIGKAKHSARNGWVYIDGENFSGVRADITLDPEAPDVKMAWKALYSSKDTWMGPTLSPCLRFTT